MNLAEFKAWLDGFSAAIGDAPTPEQWAKIREKLETVPPLTFVPRHPTVSPPTYVPGMTPPTTGDRAPGAYGGSTGVPHWPNSWLTNEAAQ
jgi:hypothetical protein